MLALIIVGKHAKPYSVTGDNIKHSPDYDGS